MKLSRNKKFDVENALVEVRILESIRDLDCMDQVGVVKLKDSFTFRKHKVLAFELLG